MNTLEALDALMSNSAPCAVRRASNNAIRVSGQILLAGGNRDRSRRSQMKSRQPVGKVGNHALHAHGNKRVHVTQVVHGPNVDIQPFFPRGGQKFPRRETLLNVKRGRSQLLCRFEGILLHRGTKNKPDGNVWSELTNAAQTTIVER